MRLPSAVRSSFHPSRRRWRASRACCSTLFTATKRMLASRTAMAMASASLRSFLPARLLRKGCTNSAAMMRGLRPSAAISRAQ